MVPEARLSITFKVGLGLLLAVTFWFRVSSLDVIPGHDGDESYEGTQVARMLQGKPFTVFTFNGNLMNPFFLALQAPIQLVAKPSLWVLRAPSVVSGALAVLLAFVLGSRVLGRPTALVAAIILATLPGASVYSRIGHEYSQIPLVGVIALMFAFRANTIGLALTVLASLIVHPINVFLLPVIAPVYLTQLVRRHADDPARLRRILIAIAACSVIGAGVLAFALFRRPIVQSTLGTRSPMNWLTFFIGFERFFLFSYLAPAGSPLEWVRWLFRGTLALVLGIGLPRLLRERQWDRVALLAGLAASVSAFHILCGPDKLSGHGTSRYGVVFIAPSVFAFGCLFQAVFAGWSEGIAWTCRLARASRPAVLIAAGAVLLFALKVGWFAKYTARTAENVWTFQAETRDPYAQALSLILRDITSRNGWAPQPCVILGETYWFSKPLEFLASWRDAVRVEQLDVPENYGPEPWNSVRLAEHHKSVVLDRLRAGGYVVLGPGFRSPMVHAVEAEFPPGQLRRWVVDDHCTMCLMIYRLERNEPRQAEVAAGPPAVPVVR
jgi:4-amino-4-deoxy-L-arabinose transferase-like glycosyltransferase